MKSVGVKRALQQVATVECAKSSVRFFKMGEGDYGEGDEFIGVTVSKQRKIAKEFQFLSFDELEKLLKSKKHEHRFTALLILVEQYKKGSTGDKKAIADFYLKHLDRVNNWDLVDTSAYQILGQFCFEQGSSDVLYSLVTKKNMWERRVAVVGTYAYIKNKELVHTFSLAEKLLEDKEDLMHKATGWMLREAGKQNKSALVSFLHKHCTSMPRTMLRYAIEKFPKDEQKKCLQIK